MPGGVKTDMEITDMFSYKEYKEIIQIIKESGRMANFKQARGKDQFIIMRHDVEFSVDRAFASFQAGAFHGLHVHLFFPVDQQFL